MSQQYDNTNSGALFRNDRKTSDSHPTHTGSINVEGKEYFLNAWVKDGKKGKFFSLSIKAKDQQPAQQKAAPVSQEMADFDQDVPF